MAINLGRGHYFRTHRFDKGYGVFILFHFLQSSRGHTVNSSHRCEHDRYVKLGFEKLLVFRQCGEHLRSTLTMAYVGDALNPCLTDYVVKQSGLVVSTHFLKAEIPELGVNIWVKVLMIFTVTVSS